MPEGEIAGAVANRPAFVLPVTWKLIDCPDSSAGPAEIPVTQLVTVWGGAALFTVRFGPATKLGASFTELTVIVNVCGPLVSMPPFDVPPLSQTRSSNIAEPLAFAAGV